MGSPGEIWLAIGVAAILLPALVYGFFLSRSVTRAMYGHEILDVLDEMADEARVRDADHQHAKSSRGEP